MNEQLRPLRNRQTSTRHGSVSPLNTIVRPGRASPITRSGSIVSPGLLPSTAWPRWSLPNSGPSGHTQFNVQP